MAKTDKITMADLNELSLGELKSLQKKVARAIEKFEQREKKKALAALEAKAKELGFSLDELTGSPKPKRKSGPRGKVAPKYANPADKSQTWTGRGRRPAWVNDALKSGKGLDDLLI